MPSDFRCPTSGTTSTPRVRSPCAFIPYQFAFAHFCFLVVGYTSQVLSDALVYSEHAGRGGTVNVDDVKLAVQSRVGWEFGGKVPKEVRGLAIDCL